MIADIVNKRCIMFAPTIEPTQQKLILVPLITTEKKILSLALVRETPKTSMRKINYHITFAAQTWIRVEME